MIDATRAIVCMHSFTPAFLHRDLKPSNFLVDDYGTCKLTGFGESRSVPTGQKSDTLKPVTEDCPTTAATGSGNDYHVVLWRILRGCPDSDYCESICATTSIIAAFHACSWAKYEELQVTWLQSC
ncbi:hypothetical protein PR003_g19653 [Phytophthora rubi]|uniref:Protein kinase domain-containing protein n=1 Tax=Phytophthora rubi TaxID=129364 RepID=A0A6A4DVP7_9STRA|nr:hypothetical protein PR002_g20452 [Phytophthora rubi]KAE9312881.1 hypothetical protein PR003_g19653 [Phytophthora rubi]